jgi:putative NIF3 family GTP cyclohydrolase 1 type 2
MKIVFIAGPFRGDGSREVKEKNIQIAKEFVQLFIENNIPFYSPHLNIDQEILSLGEDAGKFAWSTNAEFLSRCDALAVLPGWETSSGTKMEIENAKTRSLPIFYLSEDDAIQKITDWLE